MLIRGFWVLLAAALSMGLLGCQAATQQQNAARSERPMTIERLEDILKIQAEDLEGAGGQWRFSMQGIPMALLTSPEHDRMRIIAPIVEVADVSQEQRLKMLEANFHTTLDGRYAMSGGVVYAAFIHPLSPLNPEEFRSALDQVAELVRTFGTTYSSGALKFLDPDGRSGGDRSPPGSGSI